MHHILYKTTNLQTGEYYIGMHSTNDLNDGYRGSGVRLRRSIKKYGVEQFKTEVLETFESREQLAEAEMLIVSEELLKDQSCLNLKVGGEGGSGLKSHTEETKRKMSESKKRMTNETKQKMSIAASARLRTPRDEKTKQKIGNANTGSGNGNYGKCYIFSMTEKTSILIPSNELAQWLEKGWLKGRRTIFDRPTRLHPFI